MKSALFSQEAGSWQVAGRAAHPVSMDSSGNKLVFEVPSASNEWFVWGSCVGGGKTPVCPNVLQILS